MKLNFLNLALVFAGIVHTLPVIAVVGAERIEALYDIRLSDPNLLLLMQHRAVLFGLVAIVMYWAALNPALQKLAFIVGTVSMLSFIALILASSNPSAALIRIAWIDAFALIVLWVAFVWQRVAT